MDYHIEGLPAAPDVSSINQMLGDAIEAWICGPGGIVEEAFKVNGYPWPWARLARSTEMQKARLGFNPWQDQRRTGKLQFDAQHPTVGRGPGWIALLIYPGQNSYAGYHQYGTAHMPARPPLPTPTEADCAKKAEELGVLMLKARGWL